MSVLIESLTRLLRKHMEEEPEDGTQGSGPWEWVEECARKHDIWHKELEAMKLLLAYRLLDQHLNNEGNDK